MSEEEKGEDPHPLKDLGLDSPSLLTQTETFQKLSKWAFKRMDNDDSGSVNKEELYAGLLLIQLYLAKFAGPSACKPPSRETVEEIFDKMDRDESGQIEEKEFLDIMAVLCSGIATRIAVQYTLVISVLPHVARSIVAICTWFLVSVGLADEVIPWFAKDSGFFWPLYRFLRYVIPEAVLEGLPSTIVGSILFTFVIPLALDKIDDFYLGVASEDEKED
uniref:EF-hand domain-containing protein n=1 Tax=Helicotheca tamesis TaxID=374047 RepID=A0A7S2MID1_9STRA|mmetsp:Transcript_16624/g.22785  ORF Transcript_16624/g.22785 Transcript_16624/m.22785 type:complete len:219 (+) Transcript_16624:109-765(+)